MKPIGLYIHIPFCVKKCNYCDFNSFTKPELISSYISALKKEIETLKDKDYIAQTIFVGGGTPTILSPEELEDVFHTVYKNIPVSDNAEITIEANPGTLTEEKLLALKYAKVNRLSIGLQASQDRLLKIIGRIHTFKDFKINFEAARRIGFDNINIDLIFGLPTQSVNDFRETLQQVLELNPEHMSCYSLSIEEGTVFYRLLQEEKLKLPSEDEERQMYYEAIKILNQSGYEHYEISNFAVPKRQSEHNKIYWSYKEYLGLGAGAHSFIENQRFYNYPLIEDYIYSMKNLSSAVAEREDISIREQQAEFCFLGLRLLEGIDKKVFKQRFGTEFMQVYKNAVENMKKEALIEEKGDKVRLTKKGLDFANIVFAEFLP